MPRNPANKRIEILLSPAQYEALLQAAEADGYIVLLPGVTTDAPDGAPATMDTRGSVAEFVRDSLMAWHVPGFAAATPLRARGKYPRKQTSFVVFSLPDIEEELTIEEMAAVAAETEEEIIANLGKNLGITPEQARRYYDLLPRWCAGDLREWPGDLPQPECPD